MTKETCVMCSKETPYTVDTHIELRNCYIEGLGQLCASCYGTKNEQEVVCVPCILINDTPNDMELGKKVRTLYNQR
jgi:hypothetical protein